MRQIRKILRKKWALGLSHRRWPAGELVGTAVSGGPQSFLTLVMSSRAPSRTTCADTQGIAWPSPALGAGWPIARTAVVAGIVEPTSVSVSRHCALGADLPPLCT